MTYLLLVMAIWSGGTNESNTIEKEAYVTKWKEMAMIESHRTGIPAAIILGQAILESSYGSSRLSREAKNHFGIKCKRNWGGSTFYSKDDDKNARGELINSCFRSYEIDLDSFVDHSHFMMRSICYRFLLDYDRSNYHEWAKGIQECGYATDPNYANKLIRLIDKHRLWELDQPK